MVATARLGRRSLKFNGAKKQCNRLLHVAQLKKKKQKQRESLFKHPGNIYRKRDIKTRINSVALCRVDVFVFTENV